MIPGYLKQADLVFILILQQSVMASDLCSSLYETSDPVKSAISNLKVEAHREHLKESALKAIEVSGIKYNPDTLAGFINSLEDKLGLSVELIASFIAGHTESFIKLSETDMIDILSQNKDTYRSVYLLVGHLGHKDIYSDKEKIEQSKEFANEIVFRLIRDSMDERVLSFHIHLLQKINKDYLIGNISTILKHTNTSEVKNETEFSNTLSELLLYGWGSTEKDREKKVYLLTYTPPQVLENNILFFKNKLHLNENQLAGFFHGRLFYHAFRAYNKAESNKMVDNLKKLLDLGFTQEQVNQIVLSPNGAFEAFTFSGDLKNSSHMDMDAKGKSLEAFFKPIYWHTGDSYLNSDSSKTYALSKKSFRYFTDNIKLLLEKKWFSQNELTEIVTRSSFDEFYTFLYEPANFYSLMNSMKDLYIKQTEKMFIKIYKSLASHLELSEENIKARITKDFVEYPYPEHILPKTMTKNNDKTTNDGYRAIISHLSISFLRKDIINSSSIDLKLKRRSVWSWDGDEYEMIHEYAEQTEHNRRKHIKDIVNHFPSIKKIKKNNGEEGAPEGYRFIPFYEADMGGHITSETRILIPKGEEE